jgi:hypothetical protein
MELLGSDFTKIHAQIGSGNFALILTDEYTFFEVFLLIPNSNRTYSGTNGEPTLLVHCLY